MASTGLHSRSLKFEDFDCNLLEFKFYHLHLDLGFWDYSVAIFIIVLDGFQRFNLRGMSFRSFLGGIWGIRRQRRSRP